SLGFLTCLNSSAYREAVDSIVSGKFAFSDRVLLAVEIMRGGKPVGKILALNDAVISRGEISRLIRLRTRVNGEPLPEFNADGRSPVLLDFEASVTIRRSEKILPLAVLPQTSFFSVVRQKLKWSGSTL